MDKSELSAAARARRDEIVQEITAAHQVAVTTVTRRLKGEAQAAVLREFEAEGRYIVTADMMHYHADAMVWLSYFPDKTDADFRTKYPAPSADESSCPEYEPHQARLMARLVQPLIGGSTVPELADGLDADAGLTTALGNKRARELDAKDSINDAAGQEQSKRTKRDHQTEPDGGRSGTVFTAVEPAYNTQCWGRLRLLFGTDILTPPAPVNITDVMNKLASRHANDPNIRWRMMQYHVPIGSHANHMMSWSRYLAISGGRRRLAERASVRGPHARACAWCEKEASGQPIGYHKTHELIHCVWPSKRGDIPGCPRCNTLEHGFDECPQRLAMQDPESSDEACQREAFNYLVRNRESLPPIRSAQSWPTLALVPAHGTLRCYPATKAFALEQLKADSEPFEGYHLNYPDPFLDDPATASLDVIRENAASLSESEAYGRVEAIEDENISLQKENAELKKTVTELKEENTRLAEQVDSLLTEPAAQQPDMESSTSPLPIIEGSKLGCGEDFAPCNAEDPNGDFMTDPDEPISFLARAKPDAVREAFARREAYEDGKYPLGWSLKLAVGRKHQKTGAWIWFEEKEWMAM